MHPDFVQAGAPDMKIYLKLLMHQPCVLGKMAPANFFVFAVALPDLAVSLVSAFLPPAEALPPNDIYHLLTGGAPSEAGMLLSGFVKRLGTTVVFTCAIVPGLRFACITFVPFVYCQLRRLANRGKKEFPARQDRRTPEQTICTACATATV